MSNQIVFQVTVTETGEMTYTMGSSGSPAYDELILRGWLDKIREGILEKMKAPKPGNGGVVSLADKFPGLHRSP